MKAILLAGGRGTRLRPLTVHTPKPIVPIFNRPFLHYQLELLKQVPEIDEVILSLNYQPRRVEEVFGDGSALGLNIRYVVEPLPLGTAGAVKYAGDRLDDSVVVLNGDVLTAIDLKAVIGLHRERQARATIVLTPVPDPSAYGLVETDAAGNVRRFLEKPRPEEISTNHINAGIYVLEPETFDRPEQGKEHDAEQGFVFHGLGSVLELVGLVGEDGLGEPEQAQHDRQTHGGLGGRDRDHEEREALAGVVAGAPAVERDQHQVHGVEHQLDAHQLDQRVAAHQKADRADAEDQRRQREVVTERDLDHH
jgi:UTP-glucose-1-phosphate uridylyltransferase